jgi:hypothetical protein
MRRVRKKKGKLKVMEEQPPKEKPEQERHQEQTMSQEE